MDREPMQYFRMRRLMMAGAVALSLALGAVAVVGVDGVHEVLAQENDTELDGVVEVMPATGMVGTWQVSGKTVQVTEATEIDQEMGAVAVGVAVEVEGEAQPDGSILASEIEVEDEE
jgi:hypothetical protein